MSSTSSTIETKFREIPTPRAFWKRYYYDYTKSFIKFLTPNHARVFFVDQVVAEKNKKVDFAKGNLAEGYDYVVAQDVLGYIHDIELFLRQAAGATVPDGRIIITQYSALWEPILRLASKIGLRNRIVEQNWISIGDLKNFAQLAGLEVFKSGTKMLIPAHIPLISYLFNKILANIWPFNHAGLLHYAVIRKPLVPVFNKKPSFSIVVPARNEAGTIEKIARELPDVGSFTEIIFIEGNSTDNTWAEIERVAKEVKGSKRIKFAKQEGKGKGDAVRKGFDMAEGDILAIYDADMTVPPEDVARFYEIILENKADFVNGSRLIYPLEKESMRVLNFFGNKFFSMAFSWILSQPLKDTLCGTKVLRRKDYEKIKQNRSFFGDFDPFGDFDLLFGAAKLNLRIIDLPIHYRERVYGRTNISRFRHGLLLLRMTFFAARKLKFI